MSNENVHPVFKSLLDQISGNDKNIKFMNNNMTPTPWTHFIQPVRNETIRTINSGHEKRIAEMCFSGNAAEYEANTEAIVSAVNSTYGNGINPEAVKEMYDTLKWVLEHEAADFNPLEVLFNKAKAVLDKAILKP